MSDLVNNAFMLIEPSGEFIAGGGPGHGMRRGHRFPINFDSLRLSFPYDSLEGQKNHNLRQEIHRRRSCFPSEAQADLLRSEIEAALRP
jgi:hypothetical protein